MNPVAKQLNNILIMALMFLQICMYAHHNIHIEYHTLLTEDLINIILTDLAGVRLRYSMCYFPIINNHGF